jgi:hypothetical protein
MNFKHLFFAAIAMVACTTTVNAQTEIKTATATISANIITPITITKVSEMSFGNVVANTAGGTIVLSNDGVKSSTSLQLPAVAGTVTAASFTVTGQDGYLYTITLPTTYDITTGGATAAETMTLSDFTNDATNTLTGGTETFHVGATLTVLPNQTAGTYAAAAPLPVSVNYN